MNFFRLISSLLVFASLGDTFAQGVFWSVNPGAQTRIGSLDGPLAGTNIYAQMFAGAEPTSLVPVGSVHFHINGTVAAGNVSVPEVPPYTYVFVQLVAWDSTSWGQNLVRVPSDQLGRTDIVRVFLTSEIFSDVTFAPQFTQPAIVPIPEPSMWALLALGTAGLWCAHRCRR